MLFHQRGALIGRYNDTDFPKPSFGLQITFKYPDGNVTIFIQKNKQSYIFNGQKITKTMLLSSLSRLFYRTCFTRSALVLKKYLRMLISTPPNVKYALENRTPYHFFEADIDNPYRSEKIKVLINTSRISPTECALEISENIWVSINVKELNRFINIYRHNRKSSKKWQDISPEKLWEVLSDNSPSKSQILVMKAWLKQNRTDKMVEDRAKQLMLEIDRENEEIVNFHMPLEGKMRTAMFIKGKIADWVLIENNAAKTSRQRVSIYCYHEQDVASLKNRDVTKIHDYKQFLSGYLRGPICVDNLLGQVSLGDQFASRAFTLMNDKLALERVSTLRGYLPSNRLKNRIHKVHLNKYRGVIK